VGHSCETRADSHLDVPEQSLLSLAISDLLRKQRWPMRTILVSIDVYAAIWRDRRSGEQDEDAILARRFKVKRRERDVVTTTGFRDPRFGVNIQSGFQIYRLYKGKEYRAQAIQGVWILGTTNEAYSTLNRLNAAIGAGKENAWKAWFYDDENGVRCPLSDLRDPNKIRKREKRSAPVAEPDWNDVEV